MTNRTALPHARRLGLVLAALALLLSATPVLAASQVQIEARALVGGRYEVGGWAAITVTLANEGEPTEGYLSAETRAGTVRRFVEMPAGARKAVTLYVQPDAFQRRISVRYEEPNGTTASEVEVRVLEQSGAQFAVVGDGAGTLRPQILGAADSGVPEPLSLGTGDLPERPEPLAGLDGLVWTGDSTQLTDAQRRSLERWVADGGRLVVLGGPDWQSRTAAFESILPVHDLSAVDEVPQEALAAWTGADEPPVASASVSTGTLSEDARPLVAGDDGTLLLSMRHVGAGSVLFFGADLATDAHRGWSGAPGLWGRILPPEALLAAWFGGVPPREDADNSMSQALSNVPALEVPPAELLLAVIVGYILLIGPISYVLLRRLDRRELAWITAPVLVVLFTACSYGIGTTIKGGEVIVNQISLVRAGTAGDTATVQTYAGIFSPERATFDLSVDADALLARMRTQNFDPQQPQQQAPVVADQGQPARLHGLSIGVFGFEGVRADAIVEHASSLSVAWRSEDGQLVGTVTNTGSEPLEDVAYVSSPWAAMIGDLKPGASAEVEVQAGNRNGTSASDQVYGFGGFGGSSERERLILVRRQVIDALVGFGNFFPGGEATGVGGRGPYLVGWSHAPGPLPVELEGVTAQRLDHSVEILAVRPLITSGIVTINPGSMAVRVVATDGEARPTGPGVASVTNGSATFSIALPLEAIGLAATEVEILAGPEPGLVLEGTGGRVGGMWPPGYVMELRNARTGEWTPLGALDQANGFTVDDAASAVDEAGRIEVRITGEAPQADFAVEHNVFVSARVTGVMDE